MRQTYDPPVERGIPCPPVERTHNGGAPGQRRYVRIPYLRMLPGDSVFVPATDSTAQALRNAISAYRARTGTEARFSVRDWPLGFRIWRVK